MSQPPGWAVELHHDNYTTNDSRCYGLGGWNPDNLNGQIHYDLYNIWQLNYTLNESAYCDINGHNRSRPHMDFPVIDLNSWTEELMSYYNETYAGNFTADDARTVMKDNITNIMNMESRMWNQTSLDAGEQNDTVYYYSCVFDNFTAFDDDNYDEWLHLHVQFCPDEEIDESEFAHIIVGIDVDNDHEADTNDRVYWTWADSTYLVNRHAYNGDGDAVTIAYNCSIWSTASEGIGNLHRYNSHLNYMINIPLADLVKESGEALNFSDVFGLSIITTNAQSTSL